ncbi:hypothetical protein LTR78_004775 [Recurvomyces mirabilis]|uniref:Uncharacterized protein n=1 Tax=Recurvomyces mirabilis TaxID=574656 RepID=A0AAE0WPA2_9PEZI|nr:hypothetical protein LTR78_004775 [Recurvomyces mirabilis]KAK5157946.1 hypothetical protein LTS14_003869 [Recurvomyces mirabilis]
MSNKEGGASFTALDFQHLATAMTCTKSPIEVDYKLYAEKAGFKNAASAKASWNGLKKKIEKVGGGATVSRSHTITDSAENSKKGGKGGKKRKGVEGSDDGEGIGDGETKNSSSKKGPAKKKGRQAPTSNSKTKDKVVKDEIDEEPEPEV